MAKNDFQYGGWNYYTLQCGTWLWDDMPLNSPKRPPYWNSTSGFDFDHITAVNMSFCTSLRNFIQIGPPSAETMTSCRFSKWRISVILDFRGPVMASLKSPCTTSYRSSYRSLIMSSTFAGYVDIKTLDARACYAILRGDNITLTLSITPHFVPGLRTFLSY